MKIDIDSIFYFILMIIILVVSGLGSRRRKQAQKMNKPLPSSAQPGTQDPEGIAFPGSPRPAVDPFERLEQILTGQSRYESMEGESLEEIVDEEEMIIERASAPVTPQVPEKEAEQSDLKVETEDDQGKIGVDGLFQDVNEITRAIIYSEILPRKYF